MEHDHLYNSLLSSGFQVDEKMFSLLLKYADLLFDSNKQFNLTGFKTYKDILTQLILASLTPFAGLRVPRGTSFLDIGTGAGIPGIPLAICFENLDGTLLDSNSKKISFIDSVIDGLGIKNLKTVCARAEELGHDDSFRESFDRVFMRAAGNVYASIELGASFLKVGGAFYIYSNEKSAELATGIVEHAHSLGLELCGDYEGAGVLLHKKNLTGRKFPRRYSVIKREAGKYSVELKGE